MSESDDVGQVELTLAEMVAVRPSSSRFGVRADTLYDTIKTIGTLTELADVTIENAEGLLQTVIQQSTPRAPFAVRRVAKRPPVATHIDFI